MKTRNKVLLGIAIALVVLLVVAYFGMGYAIYAQLGSVKGSCDTHQANRPDSIQANDQWPPIDLTRYVMSPYETVRFPSREAKIEIAGWWIERDPGAPVVLMVHGLGGCKNAIDMLVPAGTLWRNGFNVLMIDLRDIGESGRDDMRSSIGNDEYQDVLGAWDWLVKVKGYAPERIGVFANSLGGATAVYAFAEEPRIAALFLQSSFGNLQQVVAAELKRNGYPTLLAPGALVMGSIITGDNLFARNPVTEIQKAAGRPLYIVHTQADTRMSFHQSEQLAAAAQAAGVKITTWFPENGEHVQTPAAYPQEFEQRLVRFFRETLGQ